METKNESTTNISITRRLQFCAGHRVYGHETKCKHPHGHNYILHVVAEPITELDAVGRVIDFSVLKLKLGTWIDDNWDHAFILWHKDEELVELFLRYPWKCYLMPTNPTAENMALYLLHTICPVLFADDRIRITRITIDETENCRAEAGK